MTPTHRRIIEMLRQRSEEDQNPLGQIFTDLEEEALVRHLFMNYRRGSPHGLRLSNEGLLLMKCYFRPYEIKLPDGYRVRPRHLLYLDRAASLPYYYGKDYLVLFEISLGTKLKLADGDMQILIDMDDAGSDRKPFLNRNRV